MHTRGQSGDTNIITAITQGFRTTVTWSIIDHTTLASKSKGDGTIFKQYIGFEHIQYRNDFIISLRTRTHSRDCDVRAHSHMLNIRPRLWMTLTHVYYRSVAACRSFRYDITSSFITVPIFTSVDREPMLLALTFLYSFIGFFSDTVISIAHFTAGQGIYFYSTSC